MAISSKWAGLPVSPTLPYLRVSKLCFMHPARASDDLPVLVAGLSDLGWLKCPGQGDTGYTRNYSTFFHKVGIHKFGIVFCLRINTVATKINGYCDHNCFKCLGLDDQVNLLSPLQVAVNCSSQFSNI